MSDLRKTLQIVIGGHEYDVPVDFRAIEIVEAVYGLGADTVMVTLADAAAIRRSQVARVISQWPERLPAGVTRSQVYENVVTCDPSDLAKYVGAIQGAVGYALRYIGEDEMRALASGRDLEDAPPGEENAAS